MKRPIFDELRTLDFILVRNQKIFGWELRHLSADLSPMQKSVVSRIFGRQEKLSEVAAHLGKTEAETQIILDSAVKRLIKHQSRMAEKSEPIQKNQRSLHLCDSCGTVLRGRFRQNLCHGCDPSIKNFKIHGRTP